MSDVDLRELERRWHVEGTEEAGADYLRGCLASRLLCEGRLRVAAFAGFSPARCVTGPWPVTTLELAKFLKIGPPSAKKWIRLVPHSSDEEGNLSADLYAVLDCHYEARTVCEGEVIQALGAACDAVFPQGGLHVARLAMACAAVLLGADAAAETLGDTEDLHELCSRRGELEAALGDDVGLEEFAIALEGGSMPFPVAFPGEMALSGPIRTLYDARRVAGQTWAEVVPTIVTDLFPPLRERLLNWALGAQFL